MSRFDGQDKLHLCYSWQVKIRIQCLSFGRTNRSSIYRKTFCFALTVILTDTIMSLLECDHECYICQHYIMDEWMLNILPWSLGPKFLPWFPITNDTIHQYNIPWYKVIYYHHPQSRSWVLLNRLFHCFPQVAWRHFGDWLVRKEWLTWVPVIRHPAPVGTFQILPN